MTLEEAVAVGDFRAARAIARANPNDERARQVLRATGVDPLFIAIPIGCLFLFALTIWLTLK